MRRPALYIAAGLTAGILITTAIVLAANTGNPTKHAKKPASSNTTTTAAGTSRPPQALAVDQVVQAFARALQGKGGNPCQFVTPQARRELSSPDESCAQSLRTTLTFSWLREEPADTLHAVVVGQNSAIAGKNGTTTNVARLRRVNGRWQIISSFDDLRGEQALRDALTRGEGQ